MNTDSMVRKAEPAGHQEEPYLPRIATTSESRVLAALDHWFDKKVKDFPDYRSCSIEHYWKAYAAACALVRQEGITVPELESALYARAEHPKLALGGLFLTAAYNHNTESVCTFRQNYPCALIGVGAFLAPGKILVYKTTPGVRSGYKSRGVLVHEASDWPSDAYPYFAMLVNRPGYANCAIDDIPRMPGVNMQANCGMHFAFGTRQAPINYNVRPNQIFIAGMETGATQSITLNCQSVVIATTNDRVDVRKSVSGRAVRPLFKNNLCTRQGNKMCYVDKEGLGKLPALESLLREMREAFSGTTTSCTEYLLSHMITGAPGYEIREKINRILREGSL